MKPNVPKHEQQLTTDRRFADVPNFSYTTEFKIDAVTRRSKGTDHGTKYARDGGNNTHITRYPEGLDTGSRSVDTSYHLQTPRYQEHTELTYKPPF